MSNAYGHTDVVYEDEPPLPGSSGKIETPAASGMTFALFE